MQTDTIKCRQTEVHKNTYIRKIERTRREITTELNLAHTGNIYMLYMKLRSQIVA